MILHDLISLDVLRVIWWLLLGVLLTGFALTDGFDLGVGTLLPFVGKTDLERRVAINTVGPVWEGNQVWLILGAGAIFAAWPLIYAVAFSGFYLAMFLVLCSLILRPVGFKYRSKMPGTTWRSTWDWALFVGGAVPALIFGVAMGNVIEGVPFHFNDDLMSIYEGTFFGLLNPFALLAGVVSLAMLTTHGAAWLALKAEGPVAARARAIGSVTGLVAAAGYVLAGLWLAYGLTGYHLVGAAAANLDSNPFLTEAAKGGSWMAAYDTRPWIIAAPVLGVVGMLMAALGLRSRREVSTLLWSKLGIIGVISSVGLTMFPFILPSSTDPKSSLTVWNASSSQMTLFVMLVSAVIFVPIILAYTAWVYSVLWGKVTEADVAEHSHSNY